MIDTALFDMDGLLLDTEPLWTRSMQTVSERHGIPVKPHQFKETTGLKIKEVVHYWSLKYPWSGAGIEQVTEEIIDDIIALSKADGRVMPGVIRVLTGFRDQGLKLGVATSSPTRMLQELIHFFELDVFFDVICSADEVGFGKPHPAVYLHCADLLQSAPLQCVVFEDSFNGMLSGKSARMKVVAVPDPHQFEDPRFAIADWKLRSLEDFDFQILQS
jgi:sugar-phosphatase